MTTPDWIQLSLFDDSSESQSCSRTAPGSDSRKQQELPDPSRREVWRASVASRMQSWNSKLAGRNTLRLERIPVGIHGARIGQWHPRAIYADAEIEMVFALRDAGMSLSSIARKLEMPKSTVWAICAGKLRCATPEGWKDKVVKV